MSNQASTKTNTRDITPMILWNYAISGDSDEKCKLRAALIANELEKMKLDTALKKYDLQHRAEVNIEQSVHRMMKKNKE